VASLYGRHLHLNEHYHIVETQVAPVKGRHYDVISATLDELVGHNAGLPRPYSLSAFAIGSPSRSLVIESSQSP
jgi:hypothetical protein